MVDPARAGSDRYRERYWNPTVLVRGRIAVVWTPYEFWLNGKTSHCGIDTFDMVKVDGRWKVGNAMWTVEPDACAELRPKDPAAIRPRDVWLQSFDKADVLYWVRNTPEFGRQAVYLDSVDPTSNPLVPRLTVAELRQLRAQGVRYFAPPMPALLDVDAQNRVVPSAYALDIKGAGFKIITWTFERADLRRGASSGGFYYYFDPQGRAIKKDSDMYKALDTLAKQVKIEGIFSDWPATVTYYANCMGLK